MPDPRHTVRSEWVSGSPWGDHEAARAWRGFGRKAFFGFFTAALAVASVLVGLGLGLGLVLSGVAGIEWSPILVIPLALIALAVLVARSGFRTWRPVGLLINAAGKLADGDYSVRVAPTGTRQMRSVMWSFNRMAEQLERADEQRRQLLADVGHEIRTPLTVIQGEIEAMLDGVHQPDPEHLRLLLDEVGVMERLLEDLRTLSVAEAGELSLHKEPIDLDDLIVDVIQAHRTRMDEAGVVVSLDIDRSLDDVVLDPVRIRGVVSNLVANAIHAMPDGGALRVSAGRKPEGIEICVFDTGVGIPSEELDLVFERFRKGSTSHGSGLGLTISRNLVEAHGGSIEISSVEHHGTTVVVTLPVAPDTD